jgi:hypothetical protein
VTDASDWEAEAENWIRWARTPGHDSHWYCRDAFFEEILPPPRIPLFLQMRGDERKLDQSRPSAAFASLVPWTMLTSFR